MELVKKNIHLEHMKNKISVQISLEEDHNISERNPDALRIIQKRGYVCIDDTKTYEESVWVKGTMNYEVMYMADDKERALCSVSGEIPFEQHIHTERNEKNVASRVKIDVEKLNVRLINSRKINVQCVVCAIVFVDELYEEEVLLDINQNSGMEIRKCDMEVATIVLSTKDVFRIKEEFSLPEGNSNIGRLLWKDIRLENLSYVPLDGKIQVQGILNAFFLYDGEGENDNIQSCEMTKQIVTYIEVPECEEKLDLFVQEYNRTVLVETRPDYDGEERNIYVDVEMAVWIKLFKNKKYFVINDVYGIQHDIMPVKKQTGCRKNLKNMSGKIRIEEFVDKSNGITKILHTEAKILECDYGVSNGSILMKGTMRVEILCETDDEENSFVCITKELPYEYEEELHLSCKDTFVYGNSMVCQVQSQKVSEGIEIQIVLGYQVLIQEMVCDEVVSDIMESELENTKEKPSIAVVFAKEGECIWEIGKKYQVSVDTIVSMNEGISDELKQGEKVLICKESK